MATIIDSLIVAIGLDASGFKKGQKDTEAAFKKTRDDASKTAKNLEAEGKKAAEFFGKIRNEVIALTAAVLGANGFKSFVANITTADASLGRMAKNVGMSVEELGAWQAVAARSGGSVEGMTGTIRGLSMQIERLSLTGQSELIPFLTAAHVNLAKFFNKATPMREKLLMLADAFHGMTPQKAQTLGQSMGIDEGTINLLMQGRDAVSKLRDEQEKIGHATKRDAEAAMELVSAWEKMTQSAKSLGREIVSTLQPALMGFMTWLTNALNTLRTDTLAEVGSSIYTKIFGENGAAIIGNVVGAMYGKTPSKLPSGSRKVSGKVTEEPRKAGSQYVPRGIRNNNPGNLNFAGQYGATEEAGPNGRFAVFGSMAEGVAALAKQLVIYKSRGIDSVQAIISKYAPPGENNTAAYIKSLSGRLGVSAGQHLDLNDKKVLRELILGISNVENGPGRLSLDQVNAGLSYGSGSRAVASSKTDIHIGQITVNTKATDAAGIAKSIGPALRQTALATQANQGLN